MAEGTYIHLPEAPSAAPIHTVAIEHAVWCALDAVAERAGMSPSGLAKAAGLDATAFNKSKRYVGATRRSPNMRSVHLACQVAGVSMAEFGAMVDQEMGVAHEV